MENGNLALFVLAAWALILTPGPDTLYVITRGISQGRLADNIATQMIGLGLTYALYTILYLSTVGYFAGHIGLWLKRKPAMGTRLSWFSGGVLITLGLRPAFLEPQ